MSQPLSLDALEVLDAIDRKGSFAAAAAALYRVPSAITYTVQKLEEDLGVTLFTRQGRRSVLTPAGQLLLEQGRELLVAAERVAENTRQAHRGWESCLNIAVDSVIDITAFYPHLEAFYRVRPDVEINLYEEVLGGSWEAAIEGRADLVLGAPEVPGKVSGLRYALIQEVEWVFAVTHSHPLARAEHPLTREELQRHRAVVVRDSSRSLPPLTRRVQADQPVLRVSSIQQKIDAQLRGLGAGFLPRHRITRPLERGDLVALELAEPEEPTPLHRVWRSGARGKALRWFLDRLA